MNCPACNSTRIALAEVDVEVHKCRDCGAIFGTCYLGESYSLVKPHFTTDKTADERQVYFDFTCLGSNGITRRHGWFDPTTRLLTQVG